METHRALVDSPSFSKERLLRILGVTFGVAVGIGGTIGIGILRIPGSVAAQLGHSGLIMAAWIVSGLYAFAGANTYAELGTMLPLDGGPYVYARRAYGEFGGFLVGWSDWLLRTSSMAYLAVALTEYAAGVFSYNPGVITPAAIAVLIFFTAFHWVGLRVGSRAQEIMSLFKVLAFFVIITACFLFNPKLSVASSAKPPLLSDPKLLFVAIALSMQSILGTYSGWHAPVYFSEENTDPTKSIPRSLFTGVAFVMVIYVLVNLAILHALPMSKLAGSKLAAADAAQLIFGGYSSQIVTGIMLVSLLGIINASFLFTPRVMFALSRDGLFSFRCKDKYRRHTYHCLARNCLGSHHPRRCWQLRQAIRFYRVPKCAGRCSGVRHGFYFALERAGPSATVQSARLPGASSNRVSWGRSTVDCLHRE